MNWVRQWNLVFRRELQALFNLPLFYVLCGIFFLLTSSVFLLTLLGFSRGDDGMSVNITDSVVRPTFHALHFFLLVQVPLLTMRMFSEDRADGMLDLLQTTPLSDWAILAGKFSAAAVGFSLYIAMTAIYPVTTAVLSDVEWPVAIGSLIALVLGACTYLSIGIFFSATTDSQVVAAVLSYVMIFLFAFAQVFADGTGIPALMDAARHFAVSEHMAMLLSGNIAPMNLVYFVAVTVAFLFLTARVLESRRWRS
jgi:ABC-2 type transport system permease protein